MLYSYLTSNWTCEWQKREFEILFGLCKSYHPSALFN